jgi:hypothetical protein
MDELPLSHSAVALSGPNHRNATHQTYAMRILGQIVALIDDINFTPLSVRQLTT